MAFVDFSLLLLLVGCSWIHRTSSQATEACTQQINSCACQTKSGYINLEPLDQAKGNGQPRWTGKADITYPDTTYSYNPCTAYTEGTCTSVAVCQTQYSVQYPIGRQESATFKTDSALGTILQYTSSDGRTTNVQLVCDSSREGTLDDTGEDLNNPGTYNMKLTSKYACSELAPPPPGRGASGLSTASVMLLM